MKQLAIKNLLVRGGADFSELKKAMQKTKQDMKNFKDSVNSNMNHVGKKMHDLKKHSHGITAMYKDMLKASIAMGAVAATFAPFAFAGSGVKDAMKFDALMGTLSQTLGESMKDFINWQNTVGSSLGFSKLQSAELANMMSLNFKQFATSQKDLLDKTTKMMETAAVIANKRGMAMTEVSDRVRSAMNQEADGADELGVNVRVTAMEQSKAYKEMANGQPWSELSTNMQKAILYHHILESVSTNLGDTLQNNTAMKMSVFTASLNDTKLALGQAFLPILNVVLPVLTAFMRKIEGAFLYVSSFTRALFGKAGSIKQQASATQQQATAVSGLGDATEKAGKQAKKAGKEAKGSVAAFDEINQLTDPSESAGADSGDAGGSGGMGGLTPEEGNQSGIFDNISQKASEMAKKFKEFFANAPGWKAFKDGLKDFWNALKDFWNSDAIKSFRKNFKEDLPDFFSSLGHIGGGAFKILGGIIDEFNALLNNDFSKAISGAGKIVGGLYDILTGTIGLIFPDLGKKMAEFGQKFGEKWKWFQDEFVKGSNSVVEVGKKVGISLLTNIGESILGLVFKIKPYWDEIKSYAVKKFGEMVIDVVAKFVELKNSIKTKADEAWNSFKAPFVGAYDWFKTNVVDKISSALSGISSGIGDGFKGIVTAVINKGIDLINDMLAKLNTGIQYIDKHLLPGNAIPSIKPIPRLAKGGITNGPTLALIGDNPGGQEVVSPLDKLEDLIAGAVGSAVSQAIQYSGKSSGTGGDIVLNLDGRTFARIIKPYADLENKRVGTNVRLQSI